jgi:CubicO group peptidase (beta-lactamase class C family)
MNKNNSIKKIIVFFILFLAFFSSGYAFHSVRANRSTPTKTMKELENLNSKENKEIILKSMKHLAKGSHFSGSVLIRRNNKNMGILYQGYEDRARREKITKETIFPICSISKVFCAVIIAQLIREKKLNYTDSLAKFLPELENSENVTIRELLNHTSKYSNPEIAPDHFINNSEELFQFTKNNTTIDTSENTFIYANANFVFLALVVENIEKKPYSKVIRKRIFDTLKMNHTFSPNEITAETLPLSYQVVGAQEYQADPTNYSFNLLSSLTGAGELCSTVSDLEIFFIALDTKKLLTKEQYDELFSMKNNTDNYAGGISLMEENKGYISASGSFEGEGIKSYYEGDKNGKNMTIILANMHSVDVATLGDQFFSLAVIDKN